MSAGTWERVTCSASVPMDCFATICTAFFAVNGPRYWLSFVRTTSAGVIMDV